MFTGIVVEMGTVLDKQMSESGGRFRIGASTVLPRLSLGESIAVNGVCLTVVSLTEDGFSVEAVPQTLRLTSLGELEVGSRVNLEPPLRAGDPLGGHWVMGHIDHKGKITAAIPEGNSLRLTIQPPPSLMRYIVEKGSIAVEGVSLTVAETFKDAFTVVLIPHTCSVTTLGSLKVGAPVNLEVDILGKYVEKLMAHFSSDPPEEAGTDRREVTAHGS